MIGLKLSSIGFSGGSRKRSGGGADINGSDRSLLGPAEGQESEALGADGSGCHYASGKMRFRSPIRRAFTLPTILCGSFVGLEQQQYYHHHHQRQSDSMERSDDDYQDDDDQEEHDDDHESQARKCSSGLSDSVKCDLYSLGGGEQLAGSKRGQAWDESIGRQQVVVISQSPSADISKARRRGRQSQPCSGSSSATIGPASRVASPLNFCAYDCDRSLGCESLTPLSCLVTPIRRLGAATGPSTPTTTSDQQQCQKASSSRARSSQREWAQQSAVAYNQQPTRLLLGHAANMNLLINNSIYLIQNAIQLATSSSNNNNPMEADGDFKEAQTEEGDLRPANPTTTAAADSGDRHSSGDRSSDNEEDDRPTGEQMARLRMKRFSSSALCLNDNDRQKAGANKMGDAPDEIRRQKTSNKSSTSSKQSRPGGRVDASRMGGTMRDTNGTPGARSGGQQSTSSKSRDKKPRITVSALVPSEDPIVELARQRRPSVSNQGSLNVDQQALFSAVECNQLERVKSILDGGKVNVNSLNGDKLTCLDVAVLLRNPAMVRLLQYYKAKESSAYLTSEGRENQLYSLYMEARRLVEDLSRSIGAISQSSGLLQGSHGDGGACDFQPASDAAAGDEQLDPMCCSDHKRPPQQLMLATGSLLSCALFEEKQRQLQYWRRRLDLFMQMRYGFEKLDVPSVPELVVLQVVGENSLGLKIVHSLGRINELFSSLSPQQCKDQHGKREPVLSSHTSGPITPDLNQVLHMHTMSRLISIARERRLHCPLGPKCSHWLMDELVAYRQNSDQFQLHDPNDLLIQRSGGGEDLSLTANTAANTTEVRKQNEAVRFRADRSGSRNSTVSSISKSRQQQEKLAMFNQLLVQQLTILSNQQRQQQQFELLQSSCHKSLMSASATAHHHHGHQCQLAPTGALAPSARPKPSNQQSHQQLIYAHQIESTDSAYDSIAAAAATSSRQQQQVSSLLAIQPANSFQLGSADVLGVQQQQPVYRSLAYQLMTARRYNTSNAHASDATDDGVCCPAVRLSSSSVKLPNQAHASSASQFESGKGSGVPFVAATPLQMSATSIITKYKVEWSTSANFEPIEGSMIVYNTNSYPLECQINNLENGQTYYVRVASGNHKGFSTPRPATPACLAPSSWRQVQTGTSRTTTTTSTSTSGGAALTRKKFKYDEEVFRKFTKLILLNKHILDENQLIWLQREQQQLQIEGGSSGNGAAAAKWVAHKMANLQNKSSLINMLLLDATMPIAANRADQPPKDTSVSYKKESSGRTGSSLAGDSISHQFHMTAASSPRGSLYPVAASCSTGANSATDDNDSILSGQSGNDQQQSQTSLKLRKNLRNFFQSNSAKFNKLNNQNKRGLYLATIIYHTPSVCAGSGSSGRSKASSKQRDQQQQQSDSSTTTAASNTKLVVTNDDRLPIIEIFNDLVAPSSLMADFYWLLKINGTNWIDMKRLRQQLQRSHSSSTLHLRIKLLAAIEQMQLALNLEDIGRLFYKPIQAHDGSIVICTCRGVSNTKMVSNLSIKWTSQHMLMPRHLRKISDMIVLSNKQRERQQEQQMHQQQLASVACSSHSHQLYQQASQRNQQHQAQLNQQQQQQQQQQLNKRHSSSAMTACASQMSAGTSTARPTTGLSSDNLQAAGVNWPAMPASVGNSLVSSCAAPLSSQDRWVASSCTSSRAITPATSNSAAVNLVASSTTVGMARGCVASTVASSTEPSDHQQTNLRLLSANSANNSSHPALPAEIGRLCEICQQALVQRRCTMASASSSSSLASNESQSWSSSQFSLNSQQAQSSRSCTCSRSNSSVAATLSTTPTNQNRLSTVSGYQLQPNNATATTSGTCSHLGSTQAISAPASQRNSTQSSRSASGSVGMMMMMNQNNVHHHQSSGSFGSATAAHLAANSGGSFSGPSLAATSRQTQSQQLSADPAGPQSSSTYLMLASLSLYDLLLFYSKEIIEFDQTSTTPLNRGLYLGFIQLQTTVESMRLLVPRRRPNMLPCARVRDNAHVSREEWEHLKKFVSISSGCCVGEWQTNKPPAVGPRYRQPDLSGGRSSKMNVASEAATAAAATSTSSRASDPAIWTAQPAELVRQVQRLEASSNLHSDQFEMQQNRQLLSLSSAVGAGGDNSEGAKRAYERDRAKSVSPGLIDSGVILRDGQELHAAIGRAQLFACENRQQQQLNQELLLKPSSSEVISASCNIGECQSAEATCAEECQPYAHSDTDLPKSLTPSPKSAVQKGGKLALAAATCTRDDMPVVGSANDQLQSSSDSNLIVDDFRGGQITAPAAKSVKQKRGSSSSIAAIQQSPETTFVRLIGDAARRLLIELKSQLPKVFDESRQELVSILASLNDEENNRIYHIELIELSNQVTFILLIPASENVCPVTSNERSNILAHNPDYMLLPLQIFETIHLGTYEPDLLGKYSRLSTILETDLIVAQHDHRQAFSSNELKSTKSRVSHLQDMVSIVDEFWRQLRWIVDVVSFARDKSQIGASDQAASSPASGSIKLGTIWRFFDHLASNPTANCCSSGCSIMSARKFVEAAALPLTAGGSGGSQQDLFSSSNASSTSSVVREQRQEQKAYIKSALVKTNSSTEVGQGRSKAAGTKMGATSTMATTKDGPNLEDNHHGMKSGRQEIKRTSSARLEGEQRSHAHQEPKRDRIPSASSGTPRPRLPEIQLPSSELEVGVAERQVRDPYQGRNRRHEKPYCAIPSDDEDQRLESGAGVQRGERVRRRADKGELGDKSSSTTTPSSRAIHHHPGRDLEQRNRTESSWQMGATAADLDDELIGPGEADEFASELDQESGCFEESILNVQFGERGQEMVIIGQDESFLRYESRADDDSDNNNNNNNQEIGGCREVADDDDDEAIYAYHISLRDATKAAAKRRSSQQLINLFIEQSEPTLTPDSSTGGQVEVPITNKKELESTCGRRQFERFAMTGRGNIPSGPPKTPALVVAKEEAEEGHRCSRSEPRTFAQGDLCLDLGDVIAYKFKKISSSSSASAEAFSACSSTALEYGIQSIETNKVKKSIESEQQLVDQNNGSPTATTTAEERRASQFKSTNPFLTDSFEL